MTIIQEKFPEQMESLTNLGLSVERSKDILAYIYVVAQEDAMKSSAARDNHTGWYTDLQIRDLLVAVQMFANANGGTKKTLRDNGSYAVDANLLTVAGENYGQRAETMLKAFLSSKDTRETISKFRILLDEYELS